MADQIRVFVSHHHSPEEDDFTARLVADLEAAGADVWVDDQRITSDDFIKKISEGLAGRQWLVLVMTPQSVASPWVQREVNTALNEHTAGRMLGVVPILAAPTPDQDTPMLWRTLHHYDGSCNYEPARDGLLRALGLPAAVPLPTDAPPVLSRAQKRRILLQRERQNALRSLLQDVEHDRDALSAFLNHVQLGDESGHVISEAAGLDIWYDDVLATRALPDLLASRNVEDVRSLRHSFSPQRDIDAALTKLLHLNERLPVFQQALGDELTHGVGQVLWQDYLAWEEVDRSNNADSVSLWKQREQLGRRWFAFKSTSQISRKREECRRAFVEAREQCEVIMGMASAELKSESINV